MSYINCIKELLEAVFSVNLKIIDQYQRISTSPLDKYTTSWNKSGAIHGGSNINFNLITCEDKVDI